MISTSSSPLASRAIAHTPATVKEKSGLQEEYAKDLWFFLASVIAFFTLVNVVKKSLLAVASRTVTPHKETGGERAQPGSTGMLSLRKLPSAVASSFRIVAFRIPIRLGFGASASTFEAAVIALYMSVTLVLLFINTKGLEVWFYEDRAAHFASTQLPLIVALAGKNNLISNLVGVGHEKLNILHRASARTCLMLLWMHAIGRITQGLPATFSFEHNWVRAGGVGLGAFTLAAILSVRPIRHVAFEFFLISHIVLIAIFLICGYFHTKDPGYGHYVWPALMFWALDRVLRVFGLLWNNAIWRGRRSDYSHGSVELVSDDTIRFSLNRRLTWKAGQHAYVLLPSVSTLPTEAHPFSIASICGALDGSEGPADKDVIFLIRTRKGFTDRLKARVIKSGKFSTPAFIDGPYGNPPDLSVFSTCILIAGGSGVSYTLPLLLQLVHLANAGKTSVHRVVFIWSVRNVSHLNWIAATLAPALNEAPSSLHVEVRIFVTGSSKPSPVASVAHGDTSESPVSHNTEKKATEVLSPSNDLPVTLGRPDLLKLLQEEINAASGPVSVDVSGPSALTDAVRAALRTDIASGSGVLRGRSPVTLHVEMFGM